MATPTVTDQQLHQELTDLAGMIREAYQYLKPMRHDSSANKVLKKLRQKMAQVRQADDRRLDRDLAGAQSKMPSRDAVTAICQEAMSFTVPDEDSADYPYADEEQSAPTDNMSDGVDDSDEDEDSDNEPEPQSSDRPTSTHQQNDQSPNATATDDLAAMLAAEGYDFSDVVSAARKARKLDNARGGPQWISDAKDRRRNRGGDHAAGDQPATL